jgi:glutaredoxin
MLDIYQIHPFFLISSSNVARNALMSGDILIYTTSTCKKCAKLSDFLLRLGIRHLKVVIDKDGDAEAEALMLGISAVPALKKGDAILKPRDIFTTDDQIQEGKLKQFLNL